MSQLIIKKYVYIDSRAKKSLQKFPMQVRAEFKALMDKLAKEGRLKLPIAKKIGKKLFEMRVSFRGVWRGFYAYSSEDFILVLHFFHKKTQKIPKKEIKIAQSRLTEYI